MDPNAYRLTGAKTDTQMFAMDTTEWFSSDLHEFINKRTHL